MAMPKWMSVKDGVIKVDSDGFYPQFLAEMGKSPDTADQLDMEIAYRFMQWTVSLVKAAEVASGNKLDANTIRVRGSSKDFKAKWAQKHYPVGKAKGMEWRDQLRLAAEKWRQLKGIPVPG